MLPSDESRTPNAPNAAFVFNTSGWTSKGKPNYQLEPIPLTSDK